MPAYYNENDPHAAEWLRNLIRAKLIAPGDVDERSIRDVQGSDLIGYCQVHLFAGIGGWPLALRLARWCDNRPVWTGSCPCGPYSVASVGHGGAKGQRDERHHWPDMFRLIRERKPPKVYGEQVASAISWGWWDQVAMDLEAEAFACAAAVLRADAFGADHQRKRLYWVADAGREGRQGHQHIECVSVTAPETFAIDGDPLVRARDALAGDYEYLLPGDGVSVAVERCATKGYGNAIVPKIGAIWIEMT